MNFRQLAFNNVFRNKRTYAAYFLSSAFSVTIFFLYAIFIFHPDIEEGVTREIAKKGMTAAEYIIYVFSFFFVLYSVSAFLKSRKREFGIFVMHGMSKSQLNTMIFLENMIIGFAATITGIGVGMLLAKLYLLIGANIISMNELRFYISWKALLLTVFAFTTLFLVISFFTSFFVRTNKLLDLFQSANKPKKEPKVSIILSLIAAVLLGGGYYLAATTTLQTIGIRFFPVILMTIVGTYFFYTQLSVFLLKLVKRNKYFYWKQTRLVTISDLAYRIKDNARMFFLVTIVSAVAFCAIGALSAFGGFKKVYEENASFPVSYQSAEKNPQEAKHLQAIEQDFKKQKLPFTKVKTTIIEQTDTKTKQPVELIKLSDYNQFAKTAKQETLSLKGTQAYKLETTMYNPVKSKVPASIHLKESDFSIKPVKTIRNNVISSGIIGYEVYVVSDSLFSQIKNPSNPVRYYGYYTEDWLATKDIGTAIYGSKNGIYTGSYSSTPEFAYNSNGYEYNMMAETYKTMLFVALLVGCVFFIAAGSFLYFRLYTDLDYDKRQYSTIAKVGLTEKELNKIITPQLLLLFFIPLVVAFVHSVFAFIALQSMFEFSILKETAVVLLGFGAVQVLYFLLIRSRYLTHIKKAVM
ncbi:MULTISPECIES: ABC transporter permease [Priestia]|uniref:ABC transporter permease n=1 Tax=Priestia TaxID=2800373 RepID=UPI00203F130E|nr:MULTISPECIES: ABC transporter permease [Priestia]MCM3769292.1 ABC transporter permease [Priestia aryabhattai]MDY0938705.1 ABC transporter permease [Priestia megaterium]